VDYATPFKNDLPGIIQHCEKEKCICSDCTIYDTVKCSFQEISDGVNLQAWHNVVSMVANAHLRNQRDHFVWGLHQKGLFSVNSMYRALLGVQALPYNTLI